MAGKRLFPSFVSAYSDLVLPKGAPQEFAVWTALWCLGAAVERRVWTFTKGEQLFLNGFIVLVGPPGFGKGLAIEPARRIVDAIGKNRISMSSLTRASLADDLRLGERQIIGKNQQSQTYYALNVASAELQVLFPEHDTHLLGKLTDLYDCKRYGESRRGGKGENTFILERTFLSLIGGTTPEHLFSTFPETAFKTGFFSRTMLVWGIPNIGTGDLFDGGNAEEVAEKERELTHDLKILSQIPSEEFIWEPAAKECINTFFRQNYPYGGDPVPSHPRLLHYCTRRTQHLVKLMALRAIDLGTMVLTTEHYRWAYDLLISTETLIPEIFREAAQGGETQVVNDLHHEMSRIYIKNHNKPIPLAVVVQLFGSRVQAYKIDALIEMAVTGGWLERTSLNGVGTCFVPKVIQPTDHERKMRK